MTSDAHVYFMSSHPIDIATVKVMVGRKICSPYIAQCMHELATSRFIYVLRHHNQNVDFWFGAKPRNSGTTDMMSFDQLSSKALRYSSFFDSKKLRPLRIRGRDLTGEGHQLSLRQSRMRED